MIGIISKLFAVHQLQGGRTPITGRRRGTENWTTQTRRIDGSRESAPTEAPSRACGGKAVPVVVVVVLPVLFPMHEKSGLTALFQERLELILDALVLLLHRVHEGVQLLHGAVQGAELCAIGGDNQNNDGLKQDRLPVIHIYVGPLSYLWTVN